MSFSANTTASSSVSHDTICLRAGRCKGDGAPIATPIVQTSTFCRDGVGSNAEHQYSRVSNPTVAALEKTLGELEDALPATAFGTGLGAEAALFLGLLKAGDHVVCGQSVYGGTTRLFHQVLSGLGVETTFVNATDLNEIRAAVRPDTKLIFVETPANPCLEITDIRGVSRIAKDVGAILAVDNTFLTAVLQKPLDLGADVSVYSTTKLIEGHSIALGGAIVTRDEDLQARFRFIRKCTGGIQAPFNAWLTINGLKTLPLRIRTQSATAQKVAEWLSEHGQVATVNYPSLATGKAREIAEVQHLGAHGAVVSFELQGGFERGKAFVEACQLAELCEHVGSCETLITHPASMTHADVPQDQRNRAGVTDGLLRLSVGLEPVEEIIADLEQALAATAVEVDGVKREEDACLVR